MVRASLLGTITSHLQFVQEHGFLGLGCEVLLLGYHLHPRLCLYFGFEALELDLLSGDLWRVPNNKKGRRCGRLWARHVRQIATAGFSDDFDTQTGTDMGRAPIRLSCREMIGSREAAKSKRKRTPRCNM